MESVDKSNNTENIATTNLNTANSQSVAPPTAANFVTIPVPIVNNEGTYTYATVKGSLHDRSCFVFGLNDDELDALVKRFGKSKYVANGIIFSIPPVDMLNTLAELNYKVVCSCGEAEICWTMQREI